MKEGISEEIGSIIEEWTPKTHHHLTSRHLDDLMKQIGQRMAKSGAPHDVRLSAGAPGGLEQGKYLDLYVRVPKSGASEPVVVKLVRNLQNADELSDLLRQCEEYEKTFNTGFIVLMGDTDEVTAAKLREYITTRGKPFTVIAK